MSDISDDQSLATASTVASDEVNKKPVNPATQKQKIILVSCNLLLAVGMLVWAYFTIQKFNEGTFVTFSASWKLPAGAHLKDGTATFNYDAATQTLNYRGQLNAQQQMQLRDLLEFDAATATANSSPVATAAATNGTIRSYREAIDKLAFQAGTAEVGQIQLLLLLGFMGGTLGAILRSLVDFVGHACYTDRLDLMHWWPLYVTRPLVGAILGFLLVVLLKARLLTSLDIQQGSESFWWLGVAVLGGFSTVDVTQRLRLAAKALFGTDAK